MSSSENISKSLEIAASKRHECRAPSDWGAMFPGEINDDSLIFTALLQREPLSFHAPILRVIGCADRLLPAAADGIEPLRIDTVFFGEQPLDFVGALLAEIDRSQRLLPRLRNSSTIELSTCPRNSTVEPGLTCSRRLMASRFVRLSFWFISRFAEFGANRK